MIVHGRGSKESLKVGQTVEWTEDDGEVATGTIRGFLKVGRWQKVVVWDGEAEYQIAPSKLTIVTADDLEEAQEKARLFPGNKALLPDPEVETTTDVVYPEDAPESTGLFPAGYRQAWKPDATFESTKGLSLEDLYATCEQRTGANMLELKAKYAKLNPGMQRMNLNNRIRSAARRAAKAGAK